LLAIRRRGLLAIRFSAFRLSLCRARLRLLVLSRSLTRRAAKSRGQHDGGNG
jgi:hypothetical protein